MMLKHRRLDHQFGRHTPDQLSPGILYISMEYATASHLCCCGCGEEVVTPLAPAQWQMTFDGDAVSLRPSVGNWLQKCRSHYVVTNGRVHEAAPWSDMQIAAGIEKDRAARAKMSRDTPQEDFNSPQVAQPAPTKVGVWKRLQSWVYGS